MIALGQSRYMAIFGGPAGDRAFTVRGGELEIYACTPEGAEHYHKVFLAQIAEGESFFAPAATPFALEFQILARADCAIEEARVGELPSGELAGMASGWFRRLADLTWLRYLLGLEDETLSAWESGAALGPEDGDAASSLARNLEILSSLIEARFKSAEASLDERTETRGRYRERAFSAAMRNLLNAKYASTDGEDASVGTDDPVDFAVRAAAKFLGMSTANLSLPPDAAAGLDPVTKMRRLVRKAGMQVRLVSLPKGWHRDDLGALIGYWGEGDEIAALLPQGSGKYVLVGESHPSGLPVDDETASKVKKEAFMCYAGLPPRKLGWADIFRFMLRHTRKHDWTTVWLTSFVAGLLPILLPFITESIFRDIIPINDRQALGTVAQVMLVSGFTLAIVTFVRSVSLLRVKNHAGIAFESALWSRLLSLPVRFFRDYEAGNLAGRMQGASALTELLGEGALAAVFNMVFSFWSLIMMLHYSANLTMIAAAVWAVYLAAAALLYRCGVLAQRKMADASNRASARSIQLLNGLAKFRLQGGELTAFRLWSQTFGEQRKWSSKNRWYTNYISVLNVVMPTALSMIVFYCAADIMAAGSGSPNPPMDAVKFMGFHTAFSGFNATLLAFVPLVAALFSAIPFVENIMPVLEAEPEVTDDKIDVGRLSGEVEIEDLHFSYAPDSPLVLKGISIRFKAGESVAIVGPSGCGKSTLVRILLGFERPSQGAVFFDGQDFSTLNAASVRSQMGVVLQNGQILSGDIFSNIVGSAPLSMDDAWEAARLVGLAKDIEDMPMGMHTMISEGAGNISGGQKQRILLARSIVNRPKIVILDEATSALDNITQAIVTESLRHLNATRIVVAHRLSTIRGADRIFVLRDGCVAEEGNYEELMKMDGLFAKLAKRQLLDPAGL